MKVKTLKNPTSQNIVNYPIEEADTDTAGEMITLEDGTYKKTGRTLEWSIGPGEELDFPHYVADYLASIYGFLEISEKTDTPIATEPTGVATPQEGDIACKYCKKVFKGIKGLGLHMAHSHAEELIK